MSQRVTRPELTAFHNNVVELNLEWQMFEELYTPENLPVFNRVAPVFWDVFQNRLLNQIFQSISRFFDPQQSFGQANLSLLAVAELPELKAIKSDILKRIDAIRPLWEQHIKVWRHKMLSHTDVAIALGHAKLPPVPFADVKKLVEGISGIAKDIEHRLNQTDADYHVHVTAWIPELVKYLKAGIEKIDGDREAFRKKFNLPSPS